MSATSARRCRRSSDRRQFRRNTNVRLFAGISTIRASDSPCAASRIAVDIAQSPARVARLQRLVERRIARRERHIGLAKGAVDDQGRALHQHARCAGEQSKRRLPGADMDHVDAQHGIGPGNRPVGRRGIDRQWGARHSPAPWSMPRPRRARPHRDRSAATHARETRARNARHAPRCHSQFREPGR